MLNDINISLAQINPVVGDIAYNISLVIQALETAKNADLVVCPELVVCGYAPEDLVLNKGFVQACMKASRELVAAQASAPAFLLTTPWEEDGRVYNVALFAQGGEIKSIIRKQTLPVYGVFDETRTFAAGTSSAPITVKGRKLGVMICEDMWYPDVAAHLKSQGAEALIVCNASPFDMEKIFTRQKHARLRIKETGLPLLYVNQCGGQDDLVFDGGSFGMNDQGVMNFVAPFFKNYVGDMERPPRSFKTNNLQLVYNALCVGLRDYVPKNRFPGVIIGMSGGIDSALAATIAADAIGAEKVRCVMLPSPFTSKESHEDAQACAKALGVSYEEISIDAAMAAFEKTIPGLSGLAHENMQARIRGLILMALSNQTGAMVLTTGNKSEMAVGYATLYGDMCGGFNVLKDVYKTLVYQLCHWRNEMSPVIPERILTKAPTAELREGQKDQDSLPPYDSLDLILERLIERDMAVKDIVAEGHDASTVARVADMLNRAEYKRRQSALGVKITSRAFGRDRRYPITNGYKS